MAEHWCDTHKTKFFKTAKMSGYAHPVKDSDGNTTGWCSEDAKGVAKLDPQPSDQVLPEHKEVIEKARKEVAFDPTRKSIERQTALKASVEWCIAKHNTEPIKTEMVVTVAGLFESYLENGIQKKKKTP